MPIVKPKPVLAQLKKGELSPGYALLGNEHYFRDALRAAIVKAIFGDNPPSGEDDALVEVDLASQPIEVLLDEAKALSLFSRERLILARNAEAALPSGRGGKKADPNAAALQAYFANPTPGVVIVIEAPKWDWAERDEKSKLERAAKFFAAFPTVVELRKMAPGEAGKAAASIAKKLKLSIGADMLAELADMLACDMTRMRQDLEKLALFAGERPVTHDDLEALVPEARQSGAYEFSNALANRDQAGALDVIDRMARAGEYWPLHINLVASLFRQTLAAKEKRARNAHQIRQALGALGVTVWPARAQQIADIAQRFSHKELERAIAELFRADRDLRYPNPDDRLIVERLVFAVTT